MSNGNARGKRRLISDRLPLPATVQVYNWALPRQQQQQQQQATETSNNQKVLHHSSSPAWTFRPEPSVQLLHKIRLELLVVVDHEDDEDYPKEANKANNNDVDDGCT